MNPRYFYKLAADLGEYAGKPIKPLYEPALGGAGRVVGRGMDALSTLPERVGLAPNLGERVIRDYEQDSRFNPILSRPIPTPDNPYRFFEDAASGAGSAVGRGLDQATAPVVRGLDAAGKAIFNAQKPVTDFFHPEAGKPISRGELAAFQSKLPAYKPSK